jgi:hypothetical protein
MIYYKVIEEKIIIYVTKYLIVTSIKSGSDIIYTRDKCYSIFKIKIWIIYIKTNVTCFAWLNIVGTNCSIFFPPQNLNSANKTDRHDITDILL